MADDSPAEAAASAPEDRSNEDARNVANGVENDDDPAAAVDDGGDNDDEIVDAPRATVVFHEPPPSTLTRPLFVYWVLPVIILAIFSRFTQDTGEPVKPTRRSRPVTITPNVNRSPAPRASPTTAAPSTSFHYSHSHSHSHSHGPTPVVSPTSQKPKPEKKENRMPASLEDKPKSYQELVQSIGRRRMNWEENHPEAAAIYEQGQRKAKPGSRTTTNRKTTETEKSNKKKRKKAGTISAPRGVSSDPARKQLYEVIERSREKYQDNPEDIYKAIDFADNLRRYDVRFHDGGSFQEEAIQTYKEIIDFALKKRQKLLEQGEETNRSLNGVVDVNEEVVMEYSARSIDGILCAMYCALGKTYFMANMFETAVASYNKAIEIYPGYLDAVSSRGSSNIILGKYAEAAQDFMTVIQKDEQKRFLDVYTGLARVLQAKEDAAPEGWETIVSSLNDMIPVLESQAETLGHHPEAKKMLGESLNRLHHVMFMYHDVKTKDTDSAWFHLNRSYEYKKTTVDPWNKGLEQQKVSATKQIFRKGFWPKGVGSDDATPIFVIGFVRSGSTLLERILDAHPKIVGTGENSVFNGRLEDIRNKIVQASMSGNPGQLSSTIEDLAEGVVDEMRSRWNMVNPEEAKSRKPKRFVDKMLTNYYNVGFIHMLFPNALILHVAREPMDTIFSAYKHEFPPGSLDYTSFFESLAEFYHGYRDMMEHWDRELPGRITHVRYEDMVNDTPGVARRVIAATGLPWDNDVLNFHKKKQAVNTLSTTQVRKGIYKSGMQSWRRYEEHLQPLVKLVGERFKYDLKTTLKEMPKPPEPVPVEPPMQEGEAQEEPAKEEL